jgi:hypothetical protein
MDSIVIYQDIVHNITLDRLEVCSGGECREATAQDLGLGGGFEDALRKYVEDGKRDSLVRAYQRADLRNRAILEYIEPRLPQWLAEWHEVPCVSRVQRLYVI